VDGHFRRAGFDRARVCEAHGAFDVQFVYPSRASRDVWPLKEGFKFEVSDETMRAAAPLPDGPPDKPGLLFNIQLFLYIPSLP